MHMCSGAADAGNDLGVSGFKGHPLCSFCNARFYGDGELYTHMQREHFTCFLCVRAAPDSTSPVYYRRYDELEAHFRSGHALCEHPACLEKKFIAFPGASELRRHAALEHGGELSNAQRRDALRLEVSFSVRREEAPPGGLELGFTQAGARGGRGGRGGRERGGGASGAVGAGLAGAGERAAGAAAARAAADAAAVEQALRNSAPAPTPAESAGRSGGGGANGGASGSGVRWAAAAGSQGALSSESEFPALQSQSRAAAKRARAAEAKRVSDAQAAGASAANAAATASMAARIGGVGHGAPGLLVAATSAPRAPPRMVAPPPGMSPAVSSSDDWPSPAGGRPAQPAMPPPSSSGGAGAPPPSDAARAANAALVRRVRDMLPMVTRDEDFGRFRELSAAFRDGTLSAHRYVADVAALGLASVLPELAQLLPDAGKRADLLAAVAASRSGYGGGGGAAAAAMAQRARAAAAPPPPAALLRRRPWACGACTLENSGDVSTCGACGGARRPDETEAGSALAAALEAAMLSGGKPGKSKGKGKGGGGGGGSSLMPAAQPLRSQLSNDAGPTVPSFPPLPPAPAPPARYLAGGARAHPQNVWTHAGAGAPAIRRATGNGR
jgi:hypothetical protein